MNALLAEIADGIMYDAENVSVRSEVTRVRVILDSNDHYQAVIYMDDNVVKVSCQNEAGVIRAEMTFWGEIPAAVVVAAVLHSLQD